MKQIEVTSPASKLSGDFWLGLFVPVIAVAVLAPLVLLRTWVLTALWGWYVVPAFGAQPLRMAYAFGLALLATYALPRLPSKDAKGLGRTIAEHVGIAFLTLALGWIGTWFI